MKALFGAYFPVALAVLGAAFAHAENSKSGAVSHKALEDKLAYCKTCHGVSGQGFRGAFPMPRLAGQQPEYIENQLKAFIENRRTNPVMGNVAHVLSPGMVKGLSESFHDLNPAPLGGGPTALAPEGKNIYENGVESANVPPCASCHGPDAKGDGQFPRLAGQLNDYVIKKLTNFEKERGQNPAKPDTSQIMAPIAHNLTPQQIAAVAAYVSYLK
jgi:cytochrome c553